jgi:NAD(P)-dependent dehydrogenase (short-subunit alcohol dehydrogenase family)
VVGVYRQADTQAMALQRKYDSFLPIKFDLAQCDGIADMVRSLPPPYNHIDILINNAGIKHRVSFMETSSAIWEETMGVNLRAPYFLTQAVASAVLFLISEAGRNITGQIIAMDGGEVIR